MEGCVGQFNAYDPLCPSHMVIKTISSKWVFLTVCALRRGTQRHGELIRILGGISPKMMAQTLRELERDGLVCRKAYAEVPPRVEYSLTSRGKDLAGLLDRIKDWAESNVPDILEARRQWNAGELATEAA
jgi:DNA-binding HxlR family transcriptional regulator